MKRPTIPDLAEAADVSVSTVNRVINRPESVSPATRDHVLDVAKQIGFYGLGTIQHSVRQGREKFRLGVILQQKSRTFYRNLGEVLRDAAAKFPSAQIDLTVDYLDDLSPENVAEHLGKMGETCDAVSLVAAQHPLVSDAIDGVLAKGVPVVALIAPLSAKGPVSFVGLDYWKVGRTAAWMFCKGLTAPAKIGILVGNHRYRNQELNEAGFRSFIREHGAGFTLLEPQATYESAAAARDITTKLLHDHPDLGGLFVSGGGITGVLAALRDTRPPPRFILVGYELFDATRAGLIDGTMTLAISHPMEALANETISLMVRARKAGPSGGAIRVALDFNLYTSENV